MDINAALAALGIDPDDPADAVDVALVRALVDRRAAERRLREVGHPAVTGVRIRRPGYEPVAWPVAGGRWPVQFRSSREA